ncbi:MAG TPA: STAS domain-containing protein [Terriglobales bacterium]|nr:STAS domain-containing protein [Terriglobales bacterium]
MQAAGVSLSEQGGWLTLRLEGQAGMEAAELLQQRLQAAAPGQSLAIDWGPAEHVHGSVLQVLLAFRNSLVQRGLAVAVIRDNPSVREYLRLSGLGQYFPAPADAPEPSSRGSHG